MTFETYIHEAWNDHPTQSEKLAQEFAERFSLIQSNEQIAQLIGLVTHVMGEHLARWEDGVNLLTHLEVHPLFGKGTETENALRRSKAVLNLARSESFELQTFNLSDQIRILAIAAAALADKNSSRAQRLLKKALSLAESGLEQTDPANRALAVTGNNLACALEEKPGRSREETELMLLAAKTGRKFWEIAGTWSQVFWAEYRLAMSHLQAGQKAEALSHAKTCQRIGEENQATKEDLVYVADLLNKLS